MRQRIKPSEFVPLLGAADKVRVNHDSEECSGGRDSMIVERKSDGTIVAYCFRCGGVGVSRERGYYKPPARTATSSHTPTVPSHMGGGCPSVPSDTVQWPAFPSSARRWLIEAGLGQTDTDKLGIVWSDAWGGLVIPVLNNGVVRGNILRRFDPKLYRKYSADPRLCFGHYDASHMPNVVLTEDYLSCYRVARCGYNSIALMGTEISTEIINAIHEQCYVVAAIFLDADNPTVRIKARKIAKSLPFLRTVMIETGDDPKHMSDKDLACLLNTTFSTCSPSVTTTTGSSDS